MEYLPAIVVAGFLFVLLLFSYQIFQTLFQNPRRKLILEKVPEASKAKAQYYWQGIENFKKLNPQELDIVHQGQKLHGYYLPTKNPVTIILLHGWQDEAEMKMREGFEYAKLGYSVFLPDLRSHGKSQGKYIGMGISDRYDIIAWLNHLQKLSGSELEFVLDGSSIGAAAILSLSGEGNFPKSVKALISDSSFASLRGLISGMVHFPSQYLKQIHMWAIEQWCKLICHYTFDEITPIEAVKKSTTPTFFIHGAQDKFVLLSAAQEMIQACNAPKEIWIVENASHNAASWVARDEYIPKKVKFLQQYVTKI